MPDKASGISKRGAASIAAAVICTLCASLIVYVIDVPNPVIVLVAVMIFFTARTGNLAGAASGLCIVGYALFFFSEGHGFISFTPEGRYKCAVIIVSLLAIYALVAIIRKRTEDAAEQLVDLNARLERQNAALRRETGHDELTGIYNRRGGDAKVIELLEDARDGAAAGAPPFAAIAAAIDIDDFKDINDAHGHEAGDEVLRHFARCLEGAFAGHGVAIRNGGDEFQAFAYGDDLDALEGALRRFCSDTFSCPYQGGQIAYHISCGYACCPRQGWDAKELYRKADSALYSAKVTGKHRAMAYKERAGAGSRHMQLTTRGIAENLPVAFMVYRADEGEEVVAVSNSLLALCGCADFDEFVALTGGSFRGFVHPDDVGRVESSIGSQIASHPRKLDMVDYRIATADGRVLRIHDIGRLVHDDAAGDLFYVVVYDADELEGTGLPAEADA